ncbi:TPA: glycosyltransferase [Klebsiella pneumoniae]|nr:glycosyltransferase [Klebsiella pneumoniae]HDW2321424.1 glycosyltransferase [Klebsiella pneumoniae]
MKKILIVCRAYFPDVMGGGELSTKSLAENLKKKGYDVDVLAISDKDEFDIVDNISVHRMKFYNIYWSYDATEKKKLEKIVWHALDSNNLNGIKRIEAMLERIKPDVLISSTIEDISSIIWKIAKKKKIKVIHVLRSYSLLCINANMYKRDNCKTQCISCKTVSTLKKMNSQYVDAVVGISKYILEKHTDLGYFKKSQKKVIYNICSDVGFIPDITKNANSLKLKNNRQIVIGYLGRVHQTKGIDIIFDAMTRLDDEIKDRLLFKVAGSGDKIYLSELAKLAESKMVDTQFLGSINQYDFLKQIDILIVPSKWQEPFGRVIVESMLHGVPVLVSNKGGMPELLENNEGFIFTDSISLTKKMNKFIHGEIEFNYDIVRFLPAEIVNQWYDLIEGL